MTEEIKAEKVCKKCLVLKPLSGFIRNEGCKDGTEGICRECKLASQRNSYRKKRALQPADKARVESQFRDAIGTDERGPKESAGKPNWAVFPFSEAKDVVKVFEYGAKKYGAPFTYRKGIPSAELWSAIMRHMIAIQNGEDIDPESGCKHIAHVAANALMSLQEGK